jgi:hypothetical protein
VILGALLRFSSKLHDFEGILTAEKVNAIALLPA